MTLGVLVTLADPKAAMKNAQLAHAANMPVVVDSGAWSVHTGTNTMTVERHVALVQAFPAVGARFVGLDVIGDPEASWDNWRVEREIELPVEPTLHYGCDPGLVDRYVSAGLATDWVNLGGLVGHQKAKSRTNQVAAWCAAVMVRHKNLRFHGLGCTPPRLNRLIPFDGVDSTYWLGLARHRSLALFDPKRGEWLMLTLPRRGRMRESMELAWKRGYQSAQMLSDVYDLTLTDLAEADDIRLTGKAVLSQAKFAQYFAKMHGKDFVCYLSGVGPQQMTMMQEAL